jgi:hypothetical protein
MSHESQPSEGSPISSLTLQNLQKLLPRWQVTATTIYCDVVKRHVSLKISKDWQTACTYHQRWGNIRREKKKGILLLLVWLGIGGGEKFVKVDDCKGAEKCPKLLECLEKVYCEEMALAKEEI